MKMFRDPKSDSSPLTSRIHRDLRSAILTGKIPSGTRLVESVLARENRVSKTPVREALHKLASEGLLYTIPRAGYIVEEMSEMDLKDLFETRAAIEQLAGQWAVRNITDEELVLLEENLRKTDEALKSNTAEKMIDLDVEFHHIIYKATKSKYLYRICQELNDHTLKFRIGVIQIPEVAQHVRQNHFRIYNSLKSKNLRKVEKSIAFHLADAKQVILRNLDQMRRESYMAQDWENRL